MTEKQLALLLRQIAGRLRSIVAEVEPCIEGTMESREYIDGSMFADAIMARKKIEPTQETRHVAVWRLLDYASDLEDEAELLKPTPAAAQ